MTSSTIIFYVDLRWICCCVNISLSLSLQRTITLSTSLTLLLLFLFHIAAFGPNRKKFRTLTTFLVCTPHSMGYQNGIGDCLSMKSFTVFSSVSVSLFLSVNRQIPNRVSLLLCIVGMKITSTDYFRVWNVWVITVITCLSESQSHVSAVCNATELE